MGLVAELGEGPVALDTAALIYFVEEEPRYLDALNELFGAIDGGGLPAVASALALMEVLVVPYRAGDQTLAELYEKVLVGSRNFELVDINYA